MNIDFWFEFGSTYSYPAAMRIEALAASRGVGISWRAFLLGPIFGAPSFLAGGELFWGNDRLDDALSWAVEHAD